ncbi:MAG: DUF4388 domain-containing protein, partial [Myxococcota bacterium]
MKARILIAMRDGPRRKALCTALEEHGYSAHPVGSGELAIDRFITETYDGLVVQLDLPGRDGAATIESIRWAPGGTAIATVLIGTMARALSSIALKLDVANFLEHETVAVAQSLTTQVSGQNSAITKEVEDPGPRRFGPPPAAPDTMQDPATDKKPPSVVEALYVEEAAAGVEHSARLAGALDETAFPIVLARLSEQRATGALLVENEQDPRQSRDRDGAKKIVFVRAGMPIYIQSNLEEECLGQILLRDGKIDEPTLHESIRRVQAGDGKQGGILIAMGALEPAGLRDIGVLVLVHQ